MISTVSGLAPTKMQQKLCFGKGSFLDFQSVKSNSHPDLIDPFKNRIKLSDFERFAAKPAKEVLEEAEAESKVAALRAQALDELAKTKDPRQKKIIMGLLKTLA